MRELALVALFLPATALGQSFDVGKTPPIESDFYGLVIPVPRGWEFSGRPGGTAPHLWLHNGTLWIWAYPILRADLVGGGLTERQRATWGNEVASWHLRGNRQMEEAGTAKVGKETAWRGLFSEDSGGTRILLDVRVVQFEEVALAIVLSCPEPDWKKEAKSYDDYLKRVKTVKIKKPSAKQIREEDRESGFADDIPVAIGARSWPPDTGSPNASCLLLEDSAAAQIALARRWLLDHQDPEGPWYGELDGCFDSMTALALAALLVSADGEEGTKQREAIAKGVSQLLSWQDAETGRFGVGWGAADTSYTHSICTFALAEVLLRDPRNEPLRQSVERAAKALEMVARPEGGWNYFGIVGPFDSPLSAWCCLALARANAAGIDVDEDVLAGALRGFAKVSDMTFGRASYRTNLRPGGLPARPGNSTAFPPNLSESLTAGCATVRLLLGWMEPRLQGSEQSLRQQIRTVLLRRPTADPAARDLFYWFFGSHALALWGGEEAATWRKDLELTLLPLQVDHGDDLGSWNPDSVWSDCGGRVYSTAMSLLCLMAVRQEPIPWAK